jgi:enamine deaminase RidA (YjgF/YER057c/UK114 family)
MAMPQAYCDTGSVNREIRPTTIAPPAANYAHAMLTEAPARWLHTAGVVPTAPDGSVPPELGEQASQVWSNIAAILSAAEMSAADVVSVTTYVVAGEELGPVMGARDAFLAGRRVASTLVTVAALARPEWRVEIAIVAAAP